MSVLVYLRVQLKFSKVKVFADVAYDPIEGDDTKMKGFWKNLGRILDGVGNGYKLCVMKDLNG